MNILFEEIFDVNLVGKANTNKPNLARLKSHPTINKEVAVIGIDFQNDFLEEGNLGVANSYQDVRNFAKFVYEYIDVIDDIFMSLDIHQPKQIFHPAWWVNDKGQNPEPFTVITYQDVLEGNWSPLYQEKESIEYLRELEATGKKSLIIWSYHCLQGTFGAAIETQLSNLLFAFSLYKERDVHYVTKGLNPISEMYGIVKPEYSKTDLTDKNLLSQLQNYKRIVIGGEAKSHCVLETVKQIVEEFEKVNHNDYIIYVLEDCTSSIAGFEEVTEDEYKKLAVRYPIKLTTTKELKFY
ncbi:hypothetical protein M3610_18475 [Neobacillus sp. MER 74]|uniref:hypothetical protein n=1 Tax=Bacillaceae TaxID=186817 RepID=UPI000BF81102|nr:MULTISPECIES: hypothetical protein [Bacillaceae]MCM3117264.1 hypothetical protein [Neobacillus sp. MER 74]PFP31424.1 hypothetical protein COJ96_00545 [Bacillus sp. AFS073361]